MATFTMQHGIITTEQLMYHRTVAQKIIEMRNRWKENFDWYPQVQSQQYSRYEDIYKESRAKYGEADYKKYAQMKRLRGIHTTDIDKRKHKGNRSFYCYSMDYMKDIKPSMTTNGLYGLIPPAHHHFCQKNEFKERFTKS